MIKLILLLTVVGVASGGGVVLFSSTARTIIADTLAPWRQGYVIERDTMIPMRDGVRLATTLVRPNSAEDQIPIIYVQTPYGAPWIGGGHEFYEWFTSRGYGIAVQHVRGRFTSEGSFTPTRPIAQDSYDTVSWLSELPWGSAKIGTFGCSYLGETQIALASAQHPNHKALIAQGAGGAIGKARNAYGYFGLYEGGVFQLASGFGWFSASGDKYNARPEDPVYVPIEAIEHLPILDAVSNVKKAETDYESFLTHPLGSDWWDEMGYIKDLDEFSAPALHINGWFDQTISSTFKLADLMRSNSTTKAAKNQKVIVGPTSHCQDEAAVTSAGELPIENAEFPHFQVYEAWYAHWLKGEPLPEIPNYQVFVLAENKWMNFETWPPASTEEQQWFLRSEERLYQEPPRQAEGADSFEYDPMQPMPTLGGNTCCSGALNVESGAFDQRRLEARDDVLVYTSEPLSRSLRLVGDTRAVLHISSDSVDTDFTVKLLDVFSDGRALNVRDSVKRARYRNGYDKPELMVPGHRYRIEVELPPVAYLFRAGHRIRVHISSSNFPRLERNMNTGGPNHEVAEGVVATNTIFREPGFESMIVLPVLQD